MSDFILSIEGTQTGHYVALALALWAAFMHALFGALQKGSIDPWVSRGVIDFGYLTLSIPFLFLVPWPEAHMWPIFGGMVVVHFIYKWLQAKTYERGAYTVVYPVVRGLGPLFAVMGAYVIFGERFNLIQWAGVALLLGGIFGLSAYNARKLEVGRDTLKMALIYASATGLFVAIYTTYDAYGIRASADPFTFLVWFFFLDGLNFLPIAYMKFRQLETRPRLKAMFWKSVAGGITAPLSFGAIMLATRIGNVGEAAVLRETSTVFAALIGWLVLGERVGPRRLALMTLIAAGAVVVELGG